MNNILYNFCRARKGLTLFEIMEFEKEIEPFEFGKCRIIYENDADIYRPESETLEGIHVLKFVKYDNCPYAIDGKLTNERVFKMIFRYDTISGYSIELVNGNLADTIREQGVQISEHDALKIIGNYVYPEHCTCIDGIFDKKNLITIKDFGYSSESSGISTILRCKHCMRHWFDFYYEHESFTGSGRWYCGLIDKNKIDLISPDLAIQYLNSLGWYWCGGSYFKGKVLKSYMEILI